MYNLGLTRSDRQPTHLLQTPDTFVGMPLPGFDSVTVIVHAAPAIGAAFTQYTAEFEPGGSLGPAHGQRFLYLLEGAVSVVVGGKTQQLAPGGFAHLPANQPHTVKASTRSRAAVIEKPAISLLDEAPAPALFGSEDSVDSQPLGGDEALQVKQLLPTKPGLDYAVNTMTYQPGAALAQVEIHVMEHGLLMLAGRRYLPSGELLVSGADGRFYLDGALLPAVVRRAGQNSGKIFDLQRLESPPAPRKVNPYGSANRSRSIAL